MNRIKIIITGYFETSIMSPRKRLYFTAGKFKRVSHAVGLRCDNRVCMTFEHKVDGYSFELVNAVSRDTSHRDCQGWTEIAGVDNDGVILRGLF